MFRNFWKDKRGNYAMMTAIAMVPIMGAVALAVDYTEMVREKQDTLNALDAAGIATARYISSGAADAQAITYANNFFQANLSSVAPSNVTLDVLLPKNNTGGGTLKLTANLTYNPYFLPVAAWLVGKESRAFKFSASSEIQLKNTVEVALVLDNSGSMDYYGTGSGKKRIDLLKAAAKQLIDTLAGQAAMVKQVAEPVRFGVVPFAASVNVGSDNYYVNKATWLDLDGISPIHHENFDWASFGYSNNTSNRRVVKNATTGIYEKKGSAWGANQVNTKVTRFTLFDEMKYYTNSAKTTKDYYSRWAGCVEQRPSPYDVTDTPATASNPATLFVPMFAPDQTSGAYNNWGTTRDWNGKATGYWSDVLPSKLGNVTYSIAQQQAYMPKYFDLPTIGFVAPYGTQPVGLDSGGWNAGPNGSCTTQPITPLTDVTNTIGMEKVKAAIDAMEPEGGTSVGSGLAWGWRVVSSGAPFTEGRPETEKGNDKVVIVLTDGANTYYTPSSLGANDNAGNKSVYADYGFLAPLTNAYSYGRLFLNTSSNVVKTGSSAFDNGNYTKAMNEQMATLCKNAKDSKILIMTVSLDIDPSKLSSASERAAAQSQIDGLKSCASESRFRKNDDGSPAKLYWNATGADLSDKFKEIADELSNLRIVG